MNSTHPLALTVAPVVLALAAVLACIGPVRRATGVSPMEALRVESLPRVGFGRSEEKL